MRQYIGARYVTKIYENSFDPSSAEWESGVTYEPLTMVTYNNSSYLSKKAVPGSIGDPASNPSYWAVTGAYNGQIAQLQAEVERLEKRKFILLGDSLGLGVTVISGDPYYGKGWIGHFIDYVGSDNCINASINGGGFTAAGAMSWLYQLENLNLGSHSANEFTDVVILGGSNDQNASAADIKTAMTDVVDYIRNNFSNVKRIAIGELCDPIKLKNLTDKYSQCRELGVEYISDLRNLLCEGQYYDETGNTHLTQAGYTYYSPFIANAILTGRCSYDFKFSRELTVYTGALTTLAVESGYQAPSAIFDIKPDSISVTIQPGITALYNNGDATLLGVGVFSLGVAGSGITPAPAKVALYDNDSNVLHFVGFDLASVDRSTSGLIAKKDGTAVVGTFEFGLMDYSYAFGGDATIHHKPVFFVFATFTGTNGVSNVQNIDLIVTSGMKIEKKY